MEGSRSAVAVALVVAALSFVVWWLIGGLPWAVCGFHLTGLSSDPTAGLHGVLMPLPLTVGSLPLLVATTTIGAVCAGLLPVAVTHLPRATAIIEVWAVVLLTCAVTTAISAGRVRHASEAGFSADGRVIAGLALVVAGGTVLGLALATVAITWHGATPVAAALVAGLAPTWTVHLLATGAGAGVTFARHVGDVLVAVVLGASLVVSVRRGRTAILGWPVALAVLWSIGPAVAALVYLTGVLRPDSGLPGSLPEHLDAARQVFGQAIGHTHPAYPSVALALVAGLVAAGMFARSSSQHPASVG